MATDTTPSTKGGKKGARSRHVTPKRASPFGERLESVPLCLDGPTAESSCSRPVEASEPASRPRRFWQDETGRSLTREVEAKFGGKERKRRSGGALYEGETVTIRMVGDDKRVMSAENMSAAEKFLQESQAGKKRKMLPVAAAVSRTNAKLF
eukprot:GDKH01024105.1.p1 GENE.GDKH01024105.1~~GDKH01024105.1.p1  ORF type:complete len:152 (-),score=16.93 GDKH01024105.1:96-551(-)